MGVSTRSRLQPIGSEPTCALAERAVARNRRTAAATAIRPQDVGGMCPTGVFARIRATRRAARGVFSRHVFDVLSTGGGYRPAALAQSPGARHRLAARARAMLW